MFFVATLRCKYLINALKLVYPVLFSFVLIKIRVFVSQRGGSVYIIGSVHTEKKIY
jgi:hypothetical protein